MMFVFSCLCVGMLVPPKAEAKTVKKTVKGLDHTIKLYDDGTLEVTGKNGFGECDIDTTKKSLDISCGRLCSMVLYADGTVDGGGHFSEGCVLWGIDEGCKYIGENIIHAPYPRYDGEKIHKNDTRQVVHAGYYQNPSPNENIVAIAMQDLACAVMYADGTIKVLYRNFSSQERGWKTLCKVPGAISFRLVSCNIQPQYTWPHCGVQVLAPDGTMNFYSLNDRTAWLGGFVDKYGTAWAVRQMINQAPTIDFTNLPANSRVNKAESTFNFSIKANDSTDQSLTTELYLDIGAGYKKINSFTANGTSINNGQLTTTSGTEYTIIVNKTNLIPNSVNSFKLKAITIDSGGLQGERVVNLTHYNAPSTINFYNPATGLTILNGEKVRKSNNTLEFGLKITKADLGNVNLETELYIDVYGYYQRIDEFTVNGVLNAQGKFLAQNKVGYTISFNKALYVPQYVNNFKIKAVAKDSLGEEGTKELSLLHSSDILAQWALDSVKERIAIDSSGQGNNGVINGATLATGIISNALQYDGVDDYVNMPRASFNNLANWTFEAWVKPEGPGCIYSEGNPAVTMQIVMGADNSLTIGTWHQNRPGNWNNFNTGPNVLKRNVWNHLVITLSNGKSTADSGVLNCYVDGNLVKLGNLGSQYNSGTKVSALGGNVGVASGQGLSPFKGCLDEVSLYSCALTAAEVLQNYQKVCFLEKVKITNQFDDDTTARITYGVHKNKIEFDLNKPINKLSLELELPSSIKIARIEHIYQKKDGSNEQEVFPPVTIIDGKKIVIEHPLAVAHYKIEMLLSIDEKLIVKTKSYSDEMEINTNFESEKFLFHYMDFKELPDVK